MVKGGPPRFFLYPGGPVRVWLYYKLYYLKSRAWNFLWAVLWCVSKTSASGATRPDTTHTPVYTWGSWNLKTIMNEIELANTVFATRELRAIAYVSIWWRQWAYRSTMFRRKRTLIGELTDYLYEQIQTVANELHWLLLLRSLLPPPSTPIGCADVSPENAQQNLCVTFVWWRRAVSR